MAKLLCAITALALLSAGALGNDKHADEEPKPKVPIHVLTHENFNSSIAESNCTFVLFTGPKCKYCPQVEEELEGLAEKVHAYELDCKLAKIDLTHERAIRNQFNIPIFPTIKLFLDDLVLDYPLANEHSDMTKYLRRKLSAESTMIETMEELEEAVKAEFSVVLFQAEIDPVQLRLFAIASSDFEDISFYHCSLPEAIEKYTLGSPYNIAVFKAGKDQPEVLASDKVISLVEIKNHLEIAQYGWVSQTDQPGFERITVDRKTTVFLFATEQPDLVAQLIEVSKLYTKHGILFFEAPMDTLGSVRVAEFFHMNETETVNSVRILEFRKDRIFRYKLDTFDEGKLIALLDDILAKKAVPYWKSEEPPINQRSRATVVVGKTFDELVIKSHDNVLLFLLDPEIEKCQRLVPEIEILAKRSNRDEGLMIATMNAKENEHMHHSDIQEFPLIVFYHKGDKRNPIEYHGEHTWKAMEEWARQQIIAGPQRETDEL